MLSGNDKQILLQAARRSIEASVLGKSLPRVNVTSEVLLQMCGAFVTIHKHSNLRGCIGYIESAKPLIETVIDVAAKAALEDPRFSPVIAEELSELELEISVLTPLKHLDDINEIIIGKHGLMIELGAYRGLLLPQVATAYGWDVETFLNQTALKAGLPAGAWKHPEAKLYFFSAEIFDEHSVETH